MESSPTTPYGPFDTYRAFIASLKSSTLPPVIDASMLARQSGTARSHLRTTKRFFRHIREDGAVTDGMRRLVAAYGTDGWPEAVGDAVVLAYGPVVGDLDTDTATLGQLIERFRANGGVSGSALRKAVKFYL